jgi:hypothetical protein
MVKALIIIVAMSLTGCAACREHKAECITYAVVGVAAGVAIYSMTQNSKHYPPPLVIAR